jgi:hypothetical protein
MEVIIKCVECGTQLEEHEVKVTYGDAEILVMPCDCVKGG